MRKSTFFVTLISTFIILSAFFLLRPILDFPVRNEKDGMILVYIPAGEFLRGSAIGDPDAAQDEKPQQTIYLDAFWIDKTEVTNAMFAKFVEETGFTTTAEKQGWSLYYEDYSWHKQSGVDWAHPEGPGTNLNARENRPVVHVSWSDANAYCHWAGRRLPTEAEWEKAARGTDGRIYPWGNGAATGGLTNFADLNTGYSWYSRTENDGYPFTSPVGNYPKGASPYGVFDMAGNVWEWTDDWYKQDQYQQVSTSNPLGPQQGEERVIRGGSWNNDPQALRTTNRSRYPPKTSHYFIGFRCVISEKR